MPHDVAPQESDHKIIDHHQPVVVRVGHTVAKTGSCPTGYASEASWCVAMKNALVAVPKGKGQCPSTMWQSGNYCVDVKPERR